MPGTLEHLLRRIRDGLAGPDEIVEARRLALHDARLPDELRALALQDEEDLAGDAAGLLSVLGADDLFGATLVDAIVAEAGAPFAAPTAEPLEPALDLQLSGDLLEDPGWQPFGEALRLGLVAEAEGVDVLDAVAAELALPRVAVAEAVRAEAGRVELGGAVLRSLGFPALPVAEAVAFEGGPRVDVAPAVLAALGHEALPIAGAVRREAGPCDVADAVLRAVDAPSLPLREAVLAHAGTVDVSGAVLAAVGASAAPVAEAVRAEAGTVDVSERVLRTLSPEVLAGVLDRQLDDTTHRLAAEAIRDDRRHHELTAMAELAGDVRAAVHDEAGSVDLWSAIAQGIGVVDPEHVEGWDGALLAEAVLAEAGAVDLAEAVMREVSRKAPVDMPLADMPLESLPPAANRSMWAIGSLLAAALVLVVLGGPQLLGSRAVQPVEQPAQLLTFASSDEVVVEDLQYGSDVTVFQTEGEGGAMILWLDEEAVL